MSGSTSALSLNSECNSVVLPSSPKGKAPQILSEKVSAAAVSTFKSDFVIEPSPANFTEDAKGTLREHADFANFVFKFNRDFGKREENEAIANSLLNSLRCI